MIRFVLFPNFLSAFFELVASLVIVGPMIVMVVIYINKCSTIKSSFRSVLKLTTSEFALPGGVDA